MKPNPVLTFCAVSAPLLAGLILAIHPQAPLSPRQERILTMAEQSQLPIDYSTGFNALDPSLSLSAAQSSRFDPADDYWGLPRDGDGHFELVDIYCTACHSVRIVMQQDASESRWDELLTWMVKKQGMAELEPQDRSNLLTYLADNF